MIWTYRVFGSLSGEVTTGWTEVEAENVHAASVWPVADVINTIGAPQTYHVIMRDPEQENEVRFELDYDGKRCSGERWLVLEQAEAS